MKKFLKNDLIKKISQLCIVLVMTFLISGVSIKELSTTNDQVQEIKYMPDIAVELSEKEDMQKNNLELFLENNEEQIRFFANIFDMNYDEVIQKIKERNTNPEQINEYNIGMLTDANGNVYSYPSIDRGILELFLFLETNYPQMIANNYEPYNGTAEYVEALVEYFSSLYPNVDYKVMLSIGAAESGYYTSKNMLGKNNVYGGMGSNGLITYKNIEYGVMQYIKKMSESYYDKGLNTIESIGIVFCPKQVNGNKIVSSHWLNLVNKALNEYNHELRYVSVAQLNDLLYGGL